MTFLRRSSGGGAPKVVAQACFEAADAASARREVERRRVALRDPESIRAGLIVPKTPGAPGCTEYRVAFTCWRPDGSEYRNHHVSDIAVWALSAGDARRIAAARARSRRDYSGSWRIDAVERVGAPKGSRRVRRSDPRISHSTSLRRVRSSAGGIR